MSVTAYRDMGYLPDAMLNYLVRLGWSHGDQEFFTRDELIEKFNLEHIGKSAGVFNPEKLLSLNGDHIRALNSESLVSVLLPFLKEKGFDAEPGDYLNGVIDTLKPRSKTLIEMSEGAEFYYQDKPVYDEKAASKFLKPAMLEPVRNLVNLLEKLESFDEKPLEDVFKKVMEEADLKFGKIAQPVRVALTGKTVSPGMFEMMIALGKNPVISRLKDAVQYIENIKES
jgi:glutamyl-tRNA synthetase